MLIMQKYTLEIDVHLEVLITGTWLDCFNNNLDIILLIKDRALLTMRLFLVDNMTILTLSYEIKCLYLLPRLISKTFLSFWKYTTCKILAQESHVSSSKIWFCLIFTVMKTSIFKVNYVILCELLTIFIKYECKAKLIKCLW